MVFVCVGNACRSQMAEGFARAYGSDVFEVHSAGVAPALMVPEETKRTMMERNIDISDHFPKEFRRYPSGFFDLIINMSGMPLHGYENVRVWPITDPYGSNQRVYRTVRDQIEKLVMELILELRRKSPRNAQNA